MSADMLTHPIPMGLLGGMITWLILHFFRRVERQTEDTLPNRLLEIQHQLTEIDRKLAVLVNDYEHLETQVARIETNLVNHLDDYRRHLFQFHSGVAPNH